MARQVVAGREMKQIGLLGWPVGHSLSPVMQNAAFLALELPFHYSLLPVAPEEFEEGLKRALEQGFADFNVTVPHKERIIQFLHEKSREVEATGACNTVIVRDDGTLSGYNTDIAGFLGGLREAGGIGKGAKAVIMGAGGAARGVAWALASEGHEVLILSRKPEQAKKIASSLASTSDNRIKHGILNYDTITQALSTTELLVNTTPAGQHPHVEETPLPEGVKLPDNLIVYDLIYNPRPTKLLRDAAEAGSRTQDGLAMLLHQGAAAFQLWTGKQAPIEVMRTALLVTGDQ